MRVLRVLYVLRPSGVEANLRASAEAWRANDIDIDILATGPELGPFAPALEAVGYSVQHLPQEPVAAFARRYLAMLRRNRYDLVHVQAEQGNIATVGLARCSGTRVIRSCHNSFNFEGPLRLERILQRRLLRAVGVVHVAVSSSVARSEWMNFGNPTVRIPNGFDHRRFHAPSPDERATARAMAEVGEDDFVVVSVGNCSRIKNHGAVIEALAQLPAAGEGIVYLHVGAEEDGRPERALAQRLGVAARVRFLGQRQDVDRLLQAADCYVMPSLQEGLSNAALEALASGVPAALADVPGLRDLRGVIPGISWMSPDGPGVAAVISALRAMPTDARRGTAREAAERTHVEFAMDNHVRRYVELYEGRVPAPA